VYWFLLLFYVILTIYRDRITCRSSSVHPGRTLSSNFQHQLAKIAAPAWLLATNQDLRWSKVRLRGARPNPDLRLLYRYVDMVLSNAVVDPKLANAYFNVLILAAPPSSQLRPRMVVQVMVVVLKRTAKRLLGRKEDSSFALSPEGLSSLRARPGYSKPVSFIQRRV
jgi:hypothetical protein